MDCLPFGDGVRWEQIKLSRWIEKTNRQALRDTITLKLTWHRPLKINDGWKMKFTFGMAYLQGLCSFQKMYQQGDRTQVFRPACLSHSKTVELCVGIPSLEASLVKKDRPNLRFLSGILAWPTWFAPHRLLQGVLLLGGTFVVRDAEDGWTGAVKSVVSQRWQVFGRYIFCGISEKFLRTMGKWWSFTG